MWRGAWRGSREQGEQDSECLDYFAVWSPNLGVRRKEEKGQAVFKWGECRSGRESSVSIEAVVTMLIWVMSCEVVGLLMLRV